MLEPARFCDIIPISWVMVEVEGWLLLTSYLTQEMSSLILKLK